MEKISNEQLDILINKKEAALVPFRYNMEELKTQFVIETTRFAVDWYKKTAKEYITKYPEVALSLSEEKMAMMKAGVNELMKDAEQLVQSELRSPFLWWHQEPHLHDPIDKYKQVLDKYPSVLDNAIRHVLGRLGLLLEIFGFNVSANGAPGTYKEIWFERSPVKLEIAFFYPHLLEWTEEMQAIIRRYDSLFLQAMTLFSEMQLAKEEKKRREALMRWDSM